MTTKYQVQPLSCTRVAVISEVAPGSDATPFATLHCSDLAVIGTYRDRGLGRQPLRMVNAERYWRLRVNPDAVNPIAVLPFLRKVEKRADARGWGNEDDQ